MSIQHLGDDLGRLLLCAASSVALKYAAVVLDELDHDLVTDVLILHRLQTRTHARKQGKEIRNQ